MIFRRYNRILLVSAAALLLSIATFNVIVDPYGVWRLVDLPGFNAAKTERRDHNYLFKAVDLARREAPVILYGSSRAAFGLSPTTAGDLLSCNDCVYNAALTGGHMTALTAYLEHTLEHGAALETVVWGIDFFAFDERTTLPPVFTQDRLNPLGLSAYDGMFTTIAGTTLVNSVRTVQANMASNGARQPYFDNGQLTAYEMSRQVAQEGMRARFRKSLDLYMNARFRSYSMSDRAWREFEQALKKLRQRDIRVLTFVPPTHVAHLEAIRLRGLWPQWVAFKRRLARLTPYWDFSGVNPVTAEPIDDKMSHYWDASHFRNGVGDRILAKIFSEGVSQTKRTVFGRHVTNENVDAIMSGQREALARWREQYPREADFVYRQISISEQPTLNRPL